MGFGGINLGSSLTWDANAQLEYVEHLHVPPAPPSVEKQVRWYVGCDQEPNPKMNLVFSIHQTPFTRLIFDKSQSLSLSEVRC
jgi:hypothetical protein